MYICYQLRDSNLSNDELLDSKEKNDCYFENTKLNRKPLIHDEIFYKDSENDKNGE